MRKEESRAYRMKKYKSSEVFGFYNDWRNHITSSDDRSLETRKFINGYQGCIESSKDSYESFVINLINRVNETVKANASNLELVPQIFSVNENYDQKEMTAYQGLFTHLMNDQDNKMAFAQGLSNLIDNGYTSYHVYVKHTKDIYLDKTIKVENISDNKSVFWDKDAKKSDYSDGAFCGIKRRAKISTLKKQTKARITTADREDHKVDYIQFYFIGEVEKVFVKTKSGLYKNVDYLRELDYPNLVERAKVKVPTVFTTCFIECQESPLYKPVDIGINCLPIIFDDSLTAFIEDKYESFPLCHKLIDCQRILNYQFSELAHLTKMMTSRILIGTGAHVHSGEARRNISELHTKAGFVAIDSTGVDENGDPTGPIMVLPPVEVQASLLEAIKLQKEFMFEIAASLIDINSNRTVATSGVALDKMIRRSDLIQNNIIRGHECCVNKISDLLRRIIPVAYTEYKKLYVEQYQDSYMTVEINKPSEIYPGVIDNSTLDIMDRYRFAVRVAPSEALEKQNQMVSLSNLYQIDPEAYAKTKDIFIQSLGIQSGNEISRRLSMDLPAYIVAYGKGQISFKDAEAKMQEEANRAMQQKLQIQKMDPQYQKDMMDMHNTALEAQSLKLSALSDRYRAESERKKNENMDRDMKMNMLIKKTDLELKALKLMEESNKNHNSHMLKTAELIAKESEDDK